MKFARNLPGAPAIEQLAIPLWPDAGKALGLGKNRTYDAAKAGEIPTVRFGRTIRVPVAALRKMLGEPERPDRAHDMGRSVEPTKEGPIRMKRHELLKMQVRLPPGVHEWLSAQAERNMSSINSELVRCVRDAMDRQVPCTTPPHDRPGAAS